MSDDFSEASWDERYRSRDALWSGNPNRYLVSEVSDLAPGSALDAGAGEGADAIWLAEHGWQVVAVELSGVALKRAAEHAAQRGADIAGRIDWRHEDLARWDAGADHFDLVSAQYLQLAPEPRLLIFTRLAGAVSAGGTLLIVGHHPSDLHTGVPRPHMPEVFYTGDEIAGLLDPAQWAIVTNTAPGRAATLPDGAEVMVRDTVLRAIRRP